MTETPELFPSHENLPDIMVGIRDLCFSYGNTQALKDITLNLRQNEVTAFIGPSGCGKSTLLRCINRMNDEIPGTRITKGGIRVENIDIHDRSVDVVKLRRDVGMVFQNFNLFPHMSIVKNLMIAQQLVRKTPKAEAREVAIHYLERVKIPEQANKYPIQLSGGQQQRVALARALDTDKALWLLDEPLANLDPAYEDKVLTAIAAHCAAGGSVLATAHKAVTCGQTLEIRDRKLEVAHA